MKHKKNWILIGALVVFAITIHLFSSNAIWVEHYYSVGIYPYISAVLRFLLGWLPISLGDILYGLAILWILLKTIKAVKAMVNRRLKRSKIVPVIQRGLVILLSIYIIFNTFWGVNYSRLGIASQLGLSVGTYSVDELKTVNSLLVQKANAARTALEQQNIATMTSKQVFGRSVDAYDAANKRYPFLNYHPASVKSSIWGWLGNYVGFMGYYNPFTGESQVNTMIPMFFQPYTTCHEIAHQLGYAKENEANFVGYLAATSSTDLSFQYSAYIELFLYANHNLYNTDTVAAKAFAKELLPGVKKDLNEWRQFNLRHKNPFEQVVRWGYGKYLESNQQPSGILSYDEVTGFLVAFNKKYGRL